MTEHRLAWVEASQGLQGAPARILFLATESGRAYARAAGIMERISESGADLLLMEEAPERPSELVMLQILAGEELIWARCEVVEQSLHHYRLRLLEEPWVGQRRRHQRFEIDLAVSILGLQGGPVEGRLTDISQGGAAIRSPVGTTVGSQIQLVFQLGTGLFFEDVLASVVRVQRLEESFLIGLSFEAPPRVLAKLEEWAKGGAVRG